MPPSEINQQFIPTPQRQRASTLPDQGSDDDDDECLCCEELRVGSLPNPNNFVDSASASSSPHHQMRPQHRSPRHAYLSSTASLTPPVSPRRQRHLQHQPLHPHQHHHQHQHQKSRPSPRRQRLVAPVEPPQRPAFTLEILKSIYETEDLETSVLPYFYEHFNADEYSIWLAEYRYPKDLGVMFQSEGLIHGMFQRLETMKSHAFAIVGLFGRSRGAQIQGLWIWKGKDLLFPTDPQWQVCG